MIAKIISSIQKKQIKLDVLKTKVKVIGCIPSRYASTRLPGKPLLKIGDKPMILHVLDRAKQCKGLDEVVVLTDDKRIYKVVDEAGGHVSMTSPDCANGTERIAEYAASSPIGDIFVNIQGDEVLLNAEAVDGLVADFLKRPDHQMGTLAHWESEAAILGTASTAKVVVDLEGKALYFSRNCLPMKQNGTLPERALIHIGVYIYTREILLRIAALEPTVLEKTEHLEQLRALEHGIKIGVTIVDDYQSLSVDTEDDLTKAQKIFASLYRIKY